VGDEQGGGAHLQLDAADLVARIRVRAAVPTDVTLKLANREGHSR
jgi:hypothetical protein